MTLETFLELAERWSNLGGAVQEQFKDVLDDSDSLPEQNPNALHMICRDFLRSATHCDDEEMAADAQEWMDTINQHLDADKVAQ